MSNFLYLFRGGDENFQSLSQEEKEVHMVMWQKWMGNLAQNGQLIGGDQLTPDGMIVKDRGEVITDGPFAEAAEMVGGYVIVSAQDYKAAAELLKTCPIYDYKGAFVEIREIMSQEM